MQSLDFSGTRGPSLRWQGAFPVALVSARSGLERGRADALANPSRELDASRQTCEKAKVTSGRRAQDGTELSRARRALGDDGEAPRGDHVGCTCRIEEVHLSASISAGSGPGVQPLEIGHGASDPIE